MITRDATGKHNIMRLFIFNYVWISITLIAYTVLLARPSIAQNNGEEELRRTRINQLVTRGDYREVILSKEGSIIRLLAKPRTPQEDRRPSNIIADDFIRSNKDLFGLSNINNIKLSLDKNVDGGRRVIRYDQYYNNKRVYKRSVTVALAGPNDLEYSDGAIYRIKNDLDVESQIIMGNESIATESMVIDKLQMWRQQVEPFLNILDLEEIIVPYESTESKTHLYAYYATLGDSLSTYRVVLDSETLDVLLEGITGSGVSNIESLYQAQNNSNFTATYSGSMIINPFVCSTNLANAFAANPGVNPAMSTVSLNNIIQLVSPNRLWGDNMQLKVGESSSTSPVANNGNCNFFFDSSSTSQRERRDATNIYYHIDHFIDLFNLLPPVGSIVVRTEMESATAAANVVVDEFGDFSDQRIFLRPFNTAIYDNNLQIASDVIIHEYVHLLTYNENDDLYGSVKSQRVWEGYSDAIAIIYNDNVQYAETQIGKWLLGTKSGVGAGQFGVRDVSVNHLWTGIDTADHNQNSVAGKFDEYDGALVVSSILWDFRNNSSMNDESIIKMIIDSSVHLGSNFDAPDVISAL